MPTARARTNVPDRLVDKLREANRLASAWLTAIRAAGEEGADLSLTDQEAALALFLLDEHSIQDLLEALNLLISSARAQPGIRSTRVVRCIGRATRWPGFRRRG